MMKKLLIFTYLTNIAFISISCGDVKSTNVEKGSTVHTTTFEKDTLKFESGTRSILQDSKGNYWLGSNNEGVCLFDGKTFQYFTTDDGLPNNQIRSIQEDQNGLIWISTSKGVCCFNGVNLTSYVSKDSPVTDWNSTSGNLWFFANEKDGINRFDGLKMNYLVFPKPTDAKSFTSFGVTGLSEDNDHKKWIATYSALYSYDGEDVTLFDHDKLKLEDNETLHIRSVLADSKGRVWIGNNGIGVLLLSKDSIINFSKKHGKLVPIDEFLENYKNNATSKNIGLQSIFAIEEDAEGNIWFGDRDSGAWKYDGNTLTNIPFENTSTSNMIMTIYNDNLGNLLFGLADGSVYKYDGQSFKKYF